ncbi:MAG: hypothetical protein JXC32_20965 [Anaerolineae bacterium]|nr:hypothetical protein [Anaerolineae bacterium]
MGAETWQKAVAFGDVEAVRALVRMGSGELNMAGGEEGLLAGQFAYALPEWQPEVAYEIEDGVGQLVVQPPQDRRAGLPDPEYVWDLKLGSAVPVDLEIQLGSGRAALGLTGSRLSRLEAKVGSGQVNADLSGDQRDLEQVGLASGSGRLGLILSGTYPALRTAELRNASGVTDLTLGGQYDSLTRVRLTSASGNINVGVAGQFPSLERLEAKVASGVIDLNLLEATWEMLDVSLDCVSGKAIVRYPASVGVFVRFSSVTGHLEAPRLLDAAGGYVTPNHDEAASKINLSMSTVSGKLVLQPSET